MKLTSLLLFILAFIGTVSVALATDYTSTNFKVQDPVIEELGGYSTSSSFGLWGLIPYISPRNSSATNFTLLPGFLNFPGAVASSSPTSTTPSGGGGGGAPIAPPSEPRPPIPAEVCQYVDFNHDGWVDFIDFSIMLYYFDKEGSVIGTYDLNSDGALDLIDISIFMYYWNGEQVPCAAEGVKLNEV